MSNSKFSSLVWTLFVFDLVTSHNDPDIGISLEELVLSRGFQVERYLVTTEDGYILTLNRVINPLVTELESLVPVLVQQGEYNSAINFLINSPFLYSKQSEARNRTTISPEVNDYLGDNLGFDLALTKRYDVWLGNARAAVRSQHPQHVNLSTSDPEFWAFSLDEQGRFDLPALIDFILAKTGSATLSYVGYSEACYSLFVLLTLRPEYADKLEPAISLAPTIFNSHSSSIFFRLEPQLTGVCKHEGQFFLSKYLINWSLARLCPLVSWLCKQVLQMTGGFDQTHTNKTRTSVYFSHFPTPVPNRIICHEYHTFHSGRFARFDYGSDEKNLEHYGQTTAPDYPLDQIGNVTLAFFMGRNDLFSNLTDLDTLQSHLVKSKARILPTFVVSEPLWSHADMIYGIDAGPLVYKDVIEVLDQYALTPFEDQSLLHTHK